MRPVSFLVCTLACGLLQRPPPPPEAAAVCGRVYGSTRTTLEQMYAASTDPAPEFLSKAAWVEECVAAGLDDAQLRCADPRIELVDADCAARLEPVRDRLVALREAIVVSRRTP